MFVSLVLLSFDGRFRSARGFGTGGQDTNLVPLANMLLSTLLEEALVVRDSVLAVDPAVCISISYCSSCHEINSLPVVSLPLATGSKGSASRTRGLGCEDGKELEAYPGIVIVFEVFWEVKGKSKSEVEIGPWSWSSYVFLARMDD